MGFRINSIKCLGYSYAILILSVHLTSAGLLQAIREAAIPKDANYRIPIERATPVSLSDQPSLISPAVVTAAEESNLISTLQSSLSKLSSAIQERADVAVYRAPEPQCKSGDVLCHALSLGKSLGTPPGIQGDMSKAIIKTFGTMMAEMVNSTISESLVEFMGKHGSATGETLAEEHKAMVAMAAGVLQTVSSRVIKAFSFFVQLAISGAMQNLFHQLMDGVTKVYNQHEEAATQLRAEAVLKTPATMPKPSQPQVYNIPPDTDPVQALLSAGALTSLSYPGFDVVSNLKNNLFAGDSNNLVKKRGAGVLTPYGVLVKKS